MEVPSRRGVASIVGTVFFVIIFMLALGSLAYAGGLQEQTNAAQQQGVLVAAQRGSENLALGAAGSGLVDTDERPSTVTVNHLILRFPNGTVYALSASAALPSGGQAQVSGFVPGGVCSPGTATCLSKYDEILSGNPAGSSVGLVTSLGNVFWYAYQSDQSGGQGAAVRVKAPVTTSGTGVYATTTLSKTLTTGTYAFYVFTAVEPSLGSEKYNFEVHALPSGSSLVIACAPMSYPSGGGNQPTYCVTATGKPIALNTNLGFGVSPPVFATPGIFGTVTIGATPGTLQIDIACIQNCGSVTILAGSFMMVVPAP